MQIYKEVVILTCFISQFINRFRSPFKENFRKILLGVYLMNDNILDIILQSPIQYNSITLTRTLTSLVLAFLLSRFVLVVYKHIAKQDLSVQNISGHVTLITLTTTLVIMPITTNMILSLGMVGALSVIRFRTAIKMPIDTSFLYWAVAIGITTGAGFFGAATLGTLLISILLWLDNISQRQTTSLYILNITITKERETHFDEILSKLTLLNRTTKETSIYLTYEFPKKFLPNVKHLLSEESPIQSEIIYYNGDYVD